MLAEVDYSKVRWTKISRVLDLDALAAAVAEIREDWEATGEDIFTAQTSVALAFCDLVYHLNIDQADQRRILGAELHGRLVRMGLLP